jgi:AcrR family transcriptional regulator
MAEIKQTALLLMHKTGTTDLRFSDIARDMGMTAPALYRYYADSEALLTDLIVDAYDELGSVVASARESCSPDDLWGRLLAVAQAYRQWARDEPQRFALILGMPVPGYCTSDDGPATEAAIRAMGQLQVHFVDAARQGTLKEPMTSEVGEALVAVLRDKHGPELVLPNVPDLAQDNTTDVGLTPQHFQGMLLMWAALHGFTSLEAYGHLDWLTPEARDDLFLASTRLAARNAGVPDH